MITENVKNTDNNFLEIQVLPHREYNVPFVVFDKIVSETFAIFGSDGKPKCFTVDAFESYYNQMLEKSIEAQNTKNNKEELKSNFNDLCIKWIEHIIDQYDNANKKELPNFIKPFLKYCEDSLPTEVKLLTKEVSELKSLLLKKSEKQTRKEGKRKSSEEIEAKADAYLSNKKGLK